MKQINLKNYFTKQEALKESNLPNTTFHRRIRQGKIRKEKVGVVYLKKDVLKEKR
jgi:hypothetical protein